MSEQPWAASLIREQANRVDVHAIIDNLNALIAVRGINAASVSVALTSVLGQTIRKSGGEIGRDVRDGIFALIDRYATQAAVERTDADQITRNP